MTVGGPRSASSTPASISTARSSRRRSISRGATVPKIYDWTTKTQPRLADPANGDPTWVPLTAVTVNDNGQNLDTTRGKYQLPDALKGTTHALKFGVFVEGDPRLGGELGSDVNRDGDTNDTFGVLEDTATRTVWVDTDQNHNFINDAAMKDYAVNRDVNHFGKDKIGTKDVVEVVPFVVQTTERRASSTSASSPAVTERTWPARSPARASSAASSTVSHRTRSSRSRASACSSRAASPRIRSMRSAYLIIGRQGEHHPDVDRRPARAER